MDYTLVHLRLVVRVDMAARAIAGTARLGLRALVDGVDRVRLDAAELEVAAVRCDGRLAVHRHVSDELWVELGAAFAAGQTAWIEVTYRAAPRRGLYFVEGDGPEQPATQAWSYNQPEDARAWFPAVDRPDCKAPVEVIATVPAHLRAFSNGVLVRDERDGHERTCHWRLDEPQPSYLVSLVVADAVELADRVGDVELTYCVAPGRVDEARRTCGRTPAMLERFTALFGAFPNRRFGQIFVDDFWPGGMEHTTLVTFAADGLLDQRIALDFDLDVYIAHELVHHWFGNHVTCRDWSEAWIQEGFATYAQYLWREHAQGGNEAAIEAAIELDGWAQAYFAEVAAAGPRRLIPDGPFRAVTLFDRHLYEKSARVVHMLRRLLGDDAFFASARGFLARHGGGAATTADLERAASDAARQSLGWFFDQWVRVGQGHPDLSVSAQWDAGERALRVRIDQLQAGPVFRLDTALRVVVGGRETDVAMALRDRHSEAFVHLEHEPSQVIFDPGKHLLGVVRWQQPVAWWSAEVTAAREVIDRVHAVRRSAEVDPAVARGVLARALIADPSWAVRAAAATALAAVDLERGSDDLVAALSAERSPRARRAIAAALGGFGANRRATDALIEVLEGGEPSVFVEAEACRALGRIGCPRAAPALRAAASRSSYREIVRGAAWTALADLADPIALPALLEASQPGRDFRGRCAALVALARLAADPGRGARERATSLATAALGERNADVVRAAIAALEILGGAPAIAALGELERDQPWNRVLDPCRAALGRLTGDHGQRSRV
jgi:aminopeptidase N